MAQFHPPHDLLNDYAFGNLSEAKALLVATHIALCPACRAVVRAAEEVASALIEDLPGVPVAGLNELMARLEAPTSWPDRACPGKQASADDALRLPEPLRSYAAGHFDRLGWKRLAPGMAAVRLLQSQCGETARLLRLGAGRRVPRHTHNGTEYTLVLSGGFSDTAGHYGRGDVAIAAADMDHRPVVDTGEDCVCLAVEEGPMTFTGPMGWLVSFLSRP